MSLLSLVYHGHSTGSDIRVSLRVVDGVLMDGSEEGEGGARVW
jgi:hypothetical protein